MCNFTLQFTPHKVKKRVCNFTLGHVLWRFTLITSWLHSKQIWLKIPWLWSVKRAWHPKGQQSPTHSINQKWILKEEDNFNSQKFHLAKDWSGQNQNNVSEWNDLSTHKLLFQWTSTLKIQLRLLVFSFFVSKCVSCCSCLNSLPSHVIVYVSCCLLFKNSMNRMLLSSIWVLFFM